jgi:hypothetical protein
MFLQALAISKGILIKCHTTYSKAMLKIIDILYHK